MMNYSLSSIHHTSTNFSTLRLWALIFPMCQLCVHAIVSVLFELIEFMFVLWDSVSFASIM